MSGYKTISDMIGKTFTSVRNVNGNDDQLIFENDECSFLFHHYQDCCENVRIEEIHGDLEDLVGTPLLQAEETVVSEEISWGSRTATFYKFATIKGYVTVRWLGESNGYYSESVYLHYVDHILG